LSAAHHSGSPAVAVAGAGAGPGWTSSGAPRLQPFGAGKRLGGDAGAHEPRVEQARELAGVGLGKGDRGPGAELVGERSHAVVIGREQRLRLPGGKRLDAHGSGGHHQRAIQAVGADEGRAGVGVVVGEVDGALGLAAQRQRPGRAAAHEHRRLAPQRQRTQQRLWPQMLVDVDLRTHGGSGPVS
jgi:hypothetical protein